jgi:hypothetical protein
VEYSPVRTNIPYVKSSLVSGRNPTISNKLNQIVETSSSDDSDVARFNNGHTLNAVDMGMADYVKLIEKS